MIFLKRNIVSYGDVMKLLMESELNTITRKQIKNLKYRYKSKLKMNLIFFFLKLILFY